MNTRYHKCDIDFTTIDIECSYYTPGSSWDFGVDGYSISQFCSIPAKLDDTEEAVLNWLDYIHYRYYNKEEIDQ